MDSASLKCVHVHGATLSALLHSLISAQGPVDGLLLGHYQTATRSHYQDDDSGLEGPDAMQSMVLATYPPKCHHSGMLTVSEHSAVLTETVCSSTSCSFYSPAGEVEEDALMAMLPKGQDWSSVIGELMDLKT